ncbi:MAG: death-on-curing family protein [Nocardia sp.]|uniref:type II toxin-antitoxin system death-on-curing family toxin n=1 Tax=Nocardia sp. TaxID=1821 RepID=UPI002628C55D|nr:Fic family protein [Nocardia sp.]MCU1644677.1 death-on-curing family protein [Nocardia sp.]
MRPEALIKCNLRVTEGQGRIRDLGLVAAAATRPDAVVLGKQAYPTPALKAAALFQSVIRDCPFRDGNKQTAWLAVLLLLGRYQLTVGIRGQALVDLIDTIGSELTDVDWIADQLAVRTLDDTP